ncbi:MAG TPA: FG-GAP-like repeat-containing protein, partial [Armatimonadota bacterium]|nr:FG-GAP-like repeat-containing protein [Armatimonadota bacterium]
MVGLRINAAVQYQARPLTIARLRSEPGPGPRPLGASTQVELARKHLEKAIQTAAPGSEDAARAQMELAWVLVKMGDYERAIAHAGIAERMYAGLRGHEAERRTCDFRAGVAAYRAGQSARAVDLLMRGSAGPENAWTGRWLLRLAADRLGGYPARVPPALRLTLRPDLHPARDPAPAFVDVASTLGVAKVAGAAASAWADVDGDGWDDLFVGGCNTFSNLFRFDGRRFEDVTDRSGTAAVDWGFGANFIDYDNDGAPDLYVPRYGWAGAGPHTLLHNDGHGRFADVTRASHTECPLSSTYVSAAADFDGDGFVDLFLCNGVTGDGAPNVLLHNNGNGTFSDWTQRAGLAETLFLGNGTIGAAVGDYDDDGHPDLLLVGANAPN